MESEKQLKKDLTQFEVFYKKRPRSKKYTFFSNLAWASGIAYLITAGVAATSPYIKTGDLIELTAFLASGGFALRAIFKFRQSRKFWFKARHVSDFRHAIAYGVLSVGFIGAGNLVSPYQTLPQGINVYHAEAPHENAFTVHAPVTIHPIDSQTVKNSDE